MRTCEGQRNWEETSHAHTLRMLNNSLLACNHRTGCRRSFRQDFARFAITDYKCVVLSQLRPRTARHLAELDKLPAGHIRFLQAEVIAHGRRNIETGPFVQIGFRTFVAKNVLPMIGPKRARIFPLRIDGSIAFADRDPSTFASGNGRALVRFPEPRNDLRRFRSMASGRLVVVGERAVKRILPRCEFYRNVITPMRAIWIVKPAITSGPIFVPGARAVRHGIVCARFFPDPKDGCHDVSFPRITLSRLGRRWRPMP